MAIWYHPITLAQCKQLDEGINGQGTLMKTMGIEITEIGDDYLVATMPAIPAHHNPIGMVHGGANVVLAETVASGRKQLCFRCGTAAAATSPAAAA